MDINKFSNIIEEIVPGSLQEEWDNCGWQLKLGTEIKRILVALEITDSVIKEAVSKSAELIITHHPLIFGSINKIDNNDIISNQIISLIKSGISVYSMHTSFDRLSGGNNDYLGKKLGFTDITLSGLDSEGYLRVGYVDSEDDMTISDIIGVASDKLGVSDRLFRLSGDVNSVVRKIGWCTGTGAFLLKAAALEGCDLFITGDLKYHEAQLARAIGINVLDLGHYATEKIFAENLVAMLDNCDKLNGVEFIHSELDINPFSL